MRSQMFALVIGIDQYASGSVWNLDSCVSDAQRMGRWLSSDLAIPKSHIRMLLDEEATLQNMQSAFLEHLVHNKDIQKGDAVLVYFAGHGSLVKAPSDWFHDNSVAGREAQVLCTYDYDTKTPHGRVAGLSDRSLKALLRELCRVKGDNITLILDTCFSPPSNKRDRRRIRRTATQKATAEDLASSLWKRAGEPSSYDSTGFFNTSTSTHVLLAPCGANETAAEGKEGGKFTTALLDAARSISLRRTTYNTLLKDISLRMGEEQRPIFLGDTARLIFDSAPFFPNSAFHLVTVHDEKRFRLHAGSKHGIEKGRELTIHSHNYSGQKNPSIGSFVVNEVHPTYSLVHRKSFGASQPLPADCWALVKPASTLSIHTTSWAQKLSAALKPLKATLRLSGRSGTTTLFTEKATSDEPEAMNARDVHL